MKPGAIWPIIIVGLLSMNASIVAITVYAANSDRGFAVEPDYYRKGLAWDESVRQRDLNASLGWSLTASFQPATPAASARLLARFADGAARPIRAAKLVVEAFHEADPSRVTRVDLIAQGDGTFAAPFAAPRPGLWTLRFIADAAGIRFTSAQQADVDKSGGGAARPCSR